MGAQTPFVINGALRYDQTHPSDPTGAPPLPPPSGGSPPRARRAWLTPRPQCPRGERCRDGSHTSVCPGGGAAVREWRTCHVPTAPSRAAPTDAPSSAPPGGRSPAAAGIWMDKRDGAITGSPHCNILPTARGMCVPSRRTPQRRNTAALGASRSFGRACRMWSRGVRTARARTSRWRRTAGTGISAVGTTTRPGVSRGSEWPPRTRRSTRSVA